MNSKYLIFLDFDGVVNNFIIIDGHYEISSPYDGVVNNKIAIGYLNELYNIVNYDIVVSSSWKYIEKRDNYTYGCADILYNSGLNPDIKIIGVTPDMSSREEEIENWILINNYNDKYVIIDDEENSFSRLKDNLILCDEEVGLIESDITKILEKFNVNRKIF